MTPQEFQKTFAGELKQTLEKPMGASLIQILGAMRPQYEFPKESHLLDENRGAVRGYEQCLRNLLGLTMPPKVTVEPDANYGVPEPKPKE